MVESPTLMDRWRITVLGKPVLSLPIKEPSEYPSIIDLKVHTAAGKEREIDFRFCAEGSNLISVLCKRAGC
jgi:hypothetical protein